MQRNFSMRMTAAAIGLAAGALLALPPLAIGQGEVVVPPPAGASGLFRKLDANKDGFVSRAEAKRVKGFEAAFGEADEQNRGRLTRDEFVKAEAIYERNGAKTFMDDAMITAKVKAALFKQLPATGVSVETHERRVLLSGFVDDAQDVKEAKEIATAVKGVANVYAGGLLIK